MVSKLFSSAFHQTVEANLARPVLNGQPNRRLSDSITNYSCLLQANCIKTAETILMNIKKQWFSYHRLRREKFRVWKQKQQQKVFVSTNWLI